MSDGELVGFDQPLFRLLLRREPCWERVKIANRGEIAVRVIRACQELGIETVAVYSTADADSLHVQLAHPRGLRGAGPGSRELSQPPCPPHRRHRERLRCACTPDTAFFQENAEFADLCAKCGLTFIGPCGDVIRSMGNKSAARALMRAHGVPVVPRLGRTGCPCPGGPGCGRVHRLPGAGEGQRRRRPPGNAPG